MFKKKILFLVILMLVFVASGVITINAYATNDEDFKATKTSGRELEEQEVENSETEEMPHMTSFKQRASVLQSLGTSESEYTYKELDDGTIEITGYTGTATIISIPSTIDEKKVTSIGESAFESNKIITSVTVPDTVKTIGMDAFCRCTALTTIKLPDSVESIGSWAFAYDSKLSNVTLGNGLKTIGGYAFDRNTNLKSITIPNSVETIGTYAFNRCGITSVVLPQSLSDLGVSAFSDCADLKSITLANGNTNFICTDGVIYNKDQTQLIYYLPAKTNTTFTIPNTVTEIMQEAFADTLNLKNITLSKNLTKIGRYAFSGSGITSIEFPDTVSEIGLGTFMGCESLKSAVLRGPFLGITYWMFQDCTALSEVIFEGCDNLYSFSNYAFSNCDSLVSFELPETATIVGAYCFAECDNLTTVVFNDGIELIENKWNYNSPKLTNFTIPEGLELLEDGTYTKVVTITLSDESNVYSYGEAWEVLDLVNEYRKQNGLDPLTMDEELLEAAMVRAKETSIFFDHTRPTGLDCSTVLTTKAAISGENIAAGQSTPESVMESWKESSGHNANILSTRYKSIGIGCFKIGNLHYWVQIFTSNTANEATRTEEEVYKSSTQQIAYGYFNNIGITKYHNENSGEDINAWESEEEICGAVGDTLVPETAWNENLGWSGRVNYFETTDATWSSSNTKVATVSADGTVKLVGVGTAKITITLGNITRTYNFRSDIQITGVTLDKTEITLETGKTATLTATIKPSNTTQSKDLTWLTSYRSVATVENGVVTAVRAGKATISVRTENGKTAYCTVTVVNPIPITKVTLDKTNITLEKGKTATLTATVTPNTTTQSKEITWSSGNTNIATVSSNGVVTAKGEGTTTITAKASNGLTAICTITVIEPKVTLDRTTISLEKGETATLTATITPSNIAQGKTITWESNNNNIATVDQNGKITGIAEGTAVIKARMDDKSAQCTVTVTKSQLGVEYYSHIEELAWEDEYEYRNGETSGVTGKGLKVEAIRIRLRNAPANAKILYQSHVQSIGWEGWKSNGDISGTTGQNKKIEAIRIKLENMPGYSVIYRAYVEGEGWQDWVSDGIGAGTTGKNLKLEAIEIKIVETSEAPTTEPGIQYYSHIQDIGWETRYGKTDGETSGVAGRGLKVEAIMMQLTKVQEGASIEYQSHVQDIGWEGWKKDGEQSGTTGQNKKVEAIRIRLKNMPGYSVMYRAYVQGEGWQDWVSDGIEAGTTGKNLKLEAIEVKIVKNSVAPTTEPGVQYYSHIQDIGWEARYEKRDGETSGVTGRCLKVEAIMMQLTKVPEGASIEYQAHVQDYGWENWVKDGAQAGTTGQNKKVEAIKIKLKNLPGYSVMYRAHVENEGWQDWVKDGEEAGTTGKNLRMEAIEIKIVKAN